jgi:tetratricopeptide (TPR) repeat protein
MYRENWAHALDGLRPYPARNGRTEEGESTMRQELAAFEALAHDFPDIWKYQRFAGITMSNLANLLEQQHRFIEAEKVQRSALVARTALADKVGGIPLHHQLVGHSHFNLGMLLLESDNPTSAEEELLRARADFESLRQKYGKNPGYRSDLAAVCNTLGNLWRMQDKSAKAKESWEKAIALQKELIDEYPTMLDYQYEYALSHVNLGGLLAFGGQTKKAEAMYRIGIQYLAALTEKHPDTIAYLTGLGEAHGGLGRLLLNSRDATDARTHLEQSLSNLKKALDADPKQPRFAQMRNENYQHWVAALILARDHKAAADAVQHLPRLLLEKGEGAFVAARTLAACLTLAEHDASLSVSERNVILRTYTESALNVLRKSPPASTYLKEMKRSPDFDPLRKRDEFRKWLDSAD